MSEVGQPQSLDEAAGAEPGDLPPRADLNEADARNLAFLVSHHLARNQWRLTSEPQRAADEMAELASVVAGKLRSLSLRLAGEDARARLTGVR